MRAIKRTTQFKSDFKRLLREKSRRKFPEFYEEFESIIQKLADDCPLEEKYADHALAGNWRGYRDCHIRPDLVLIYRYDSEKTLELLVLARLGSLSELRLS